MLNLKLQILIPILFVFIWIGCSRSSPANPNTNPSPNYSGCDSIRLGLLNLSHADSIRLSSCLKLTGCDSIRLNLINLSRNDSIRLASCLNLSHNDSLSLFPSIFSGIITTIAGNGINGFSGDGGPATSAEFSNPLGIATDASGNVYFTDNNNHDIRKISTSGIITTIAGNGINGFSGDGGLATSAKLSNPSGLAIDAIGNIYFADEGNARIRKVSASGIITTFAGNGIRGFSGDGGLAISAALTCPYGVSLDASGNVYFSDSCNNVIRRISTSGIITTIAGNAIQGNSGDGGPATSAELNGPGALTTDASGNIYFSDKGNYRIRKISTSGIITTIAGNGTPGFSGDGGPAISAELNFTSGPVIDASGNIYFGDFLNYRIRKISTSGIITTIAGNGTPGFSGDGGPAVSAKLNSPLGITLDPLGNIFFIDNSNFRIRRISK